MYQGFFREEKHYSLGDIGFELGIGVEEAAQLAGLLKKYGIIKAVKRQKPEFKKLAEEELVLTDASLELADVRYVFCFVGILTTGPYVLKCYPKYIKSSSAPVKELKVILKVIKKYNETEPQVFFYQEDEEEGIFNRLAVSLYLLEEYHSYGLYSNQKEIVEINGEGEILWDQTINETFAIIEKGRPYYTELKTRGMEDYEDDFCRRLHECILSICSRELKNAGLLELFELEEAEFTEKELEELGEESVLLWRLQREISIQYVTRKQNLLKTLYTYIACGSTQRTKQGLNLYGTSHFNQIWERVCSECFGNVLKRTLKSLPGGLSESYRHRENQLLREIIERPVWTRYGGNEKAEADTLRPDIIILYPYQESYCFCILDAKYYCITIDQNKVTGQPGIEDITKQYLYSWACRTFIEKQGYQYVQNAFLCPSEKGNSIYGNVRMDMMKMSWGPEAISVVFLQAEELYDCFLAGRMIENPQSYLPKAKRRFL